MNTGNPEEIMAGMAAGTVRSVTFVTGQTLRCVEAQPDLFILEVIWPGQAPKAWASDRSALFERLVSAPIVKVEAAPTVGPFDLIRQLTDAAIAAAAYLALDVVPEPPVLMDVQGKLAAAIEAAAAVIPFEDDKPTTYRAVTGSGLGIIRVTASSEAEARTEIVDQLSRPGRYPGLESWRRGGEKVEIVP